MPAGTSRFDLHAPNAARMCNYWLGGHDNYDADRKRADEIGRACPPVPQMARDNRKFAGRAVTWAASWHGIRSYVDLGSGLLPAGRRRRGRFTTRPGQLSPAPGSPTWTATATSPTTPPGTSAGTAG